jgi:hypothetical protein
LRNFFIVESDDGDDDEEEEDELNPVCVCVCLLTLWKCNYMGIPFGAERLLKNSSKQNGNAKV